MGVKIIIWGILFLLLLLDFINYIEYRILGLKRTGWGEAGPALARVELAMVERALASPSLGELELARI